MLCNMESAAADMIEALLRAAPQMPAEPDRGPDRQTLISRMAFVIEDRLSIGESVAREDFIRALVPEREIDSLAADAMALANARMTATEARGIRRARVLAGRSA